MRYVTARLDEQQAELAYRIYVSDALKVIGSLNARYFDFIKPVARETRTEEEIIDHIKRKLEEQ